MSDRIEEAEAVVDYYHRVRAVGHSHAVIEGAREADALVVFPYLDTAKQFPEIDPSRVVTFSRLENGWLKGRRDPLVLDNSATTRLLDALLTEIDLLEEREAVLRKALEEACRTGFMERTDTKMNNLIEWAEHELGVRSE